MLLGNFEVAVVDVASFKVNLAKQGLGARTKQKQQKYYLHQFQLDEIKTSYVVFSFRDTYRNTTSEIRKFSLQSLQGLRHHLQLHKLPGESAEVIPALLIQPCRSALHLRRRAATAHLHQLQLDAKRTIHFSPRAVAFLVQINEAIFCEAAGGKF
ncbi:hypothetical protein EJB05_35462 [Eragrostis curvula]|uniref:Uncharacterized protein n=1 Tax=Eragrostis curvula TaxID=38414 RepID=A0A5J9U6N8_9POAL|nr:hypothetical protein EJB05_35462 [Eragrostis curvula]